MTPLRLIGYWIESLDDEYFPPPQELEAKWDADSRMKVINYLNLGRLLTHFRGLTWCRYYCDKPMGSRELTDGTWAWPEDLAHYVQDHNVQLPEELIETACDDVPKCRDAVDVLQRTEVSYWIEWSTKHRSNSLRSKIQSARERASMKSKRLKEFAIWQLERSTDLSAKQCRGDNCPNQALSRCAHCSRCYVEIELSDRIRRPFENLKPVLADS